MGLDGTQSNGSPEPVRWLVPCRAFEVPPRAGTRWRKALAGAKLRPESKGRQSETLLDTLDRRLSRAGIELRASGEAPRIVLRVAVAVLPSDDGREPGLEGTFVMASLPRFAWDFPPAQALPLARILEARALEPIGVHEQELARWAVLDDQRKVVAWIDEEHHRIRPSGRRARSTRSVHRVLLRGLRGYDREFARLAPLVEASGLVAASSGAFDAHALLGNGARSPAWPVLAPHVSAFAGLAHIVRTQLRVLELNAAGLRAGVDAEYLHDSRIALRRLRTLLGQLEGILDAEQQAHLVAELRWLAGCTGAARDLDILLFAMRLSEPELRADLAPVLSILEQVRERAQHELVAALDSPRSAECLRSLRAAFWAGNEQGRNGPRAGSPFARVLAKRLRRRLRQVLTRAERVGGASPAAELHGLRIACKKLRYLLECCRGLAPKPVLVPCFAPLKGLQEILGQVQDAEVEVGLVHELAMGPAAGAGARAHLALGRFLERSVQRGCSARDRYPELASALLAPPVRAQLEVLVEALEARAPSQR